MRATIILYTEKLPPETVELVVNGVVYEAKLLGSKQLAEGDFENTLSVGRG